MIQRAAAVFLLVTLLDVVWALYIAQVSRGKPLLSAFTSAIIALLSGAAVVIYVREPPMLAAAVAGAFAGTYVAVRWMS